MSIINVIVIPAAKDQPVRADTYDSTDYKNLTALIFNGDREGTFDRMTAVDTLGAEVTIWLDDNGLARLDTEELGDIINLRAMQLFADLNGKTGLQDYDSPLIGDVVITGGADEDGNSLDAPGWILTYPLNWHLRYTMRRKQVES